MNKPLGLEAAQDFAISKGWTCLSTSYKDSRTPMHWQCSCGFEWEAPFTRLRSGHGCPSCAGNLMLTLEKIQATARERGGECLSTSYKGLRSKMKFRCKEGHEWTALAVSVKFGHWCPTCGHLISAAGVSAYFAERRARHRTRKTVA